MEVLQIHKGTEMLEITEEGFGDLCLIIRTLHGKNCSSPFKAVLTSEETESQLGMYVCLTFPLVVNKSTRNKPMHSSNCIG